MMNLLEQAKLIFRKKGPEILTGFGIAGMTTSIILSVRATSEAIKRINIKKEKEKKEKLQTEEIVKTVWVCYIPSFTAWITSIACLIGSSVLNDRRNAALMAAYSLAETNLKDLTMKTKELIGEKKTEEIMTAIDKDRLERNPLPIKEDEDESLETSSGERLMRIMDPYERYFYSNRTIIDRAVNKLNNQMNTSFMPYVSLNDFLREIEAPKLDDVGDRLGWNASSNQIEVRYSSHWINPYTVRGCFTFVNPPKYGFDTP